MKQITKYHILFNPIHMSWVEFVKPLELFHKLHLHYFFKKFPSFFVLILTYVGILNDEVTQIMV